MAESTTITQNTEVPVNSTPTLIASVYGRKVFGLNDTVPVENYQSEFYYNILPFKVKEIIIDYCFLDIFMKEMMITILLDITFQKEKEYINDKLSELFEFKWKDFVNNKLLEKVNLQSTTTRPFQTIKNVYALDGDCIIIELDNNILFYYVNNDQYYVIPVNNVKWIKGGIMSDKVYIYTNLNELFTFRTGTLEKIVLKSFPFILDERSKTASSIYSMINRNNNNNFEIIK
ncbi:hypothetical protein ABK040_000756 [Willaertia magna]